jgi:hypothetical protein
VCLLALESPPTCMHCAANAAHTRAARATTPPPPPPPHRRIVEFAEKPKGDALKAMRVDTTVLGLDAEAAKEQPYIASMGIYVCKARVLEELLTGLLKDANDFGSEIIPGAKDQGYKVQVRGRARGVGGGAAEERAGWGECGGR